MLPWADNEAKNGFASQNLLHVFFFAPVIALYRGTTGVTAGQARLWIAEAGPFSVAGERLTAGNKQSAEHRQ